MARPRLKFLSKQDTTTSGTWTEHSMLENRNVDTRAESNIMKISDGGMRTIMGNLDTDQ